MEQNFIENELIIFTKQTYDAFLKSDNPAELIALYSFYYYTAKWQKTNQPKCTTGYAANGLKWSESKIRKFKKELIDLGLIEDVALRDEHNKIAGHYIKLNYILKQSTLEESHTIENPQCGNSDSVEEMGTNALSGNNINALSTNNKNKNKKTEYDVIIENYTDNIELRNTIYEFIKMRKGIKKTITSYGLKKMLNKLDRLAANDDEKIQILDKSIERSWAGVFELKDNKGGNNGGENRKHSESTDDELPECSGIVSLFNQICVSLPKVEKITAGRKQRIKAADKELNGDFEGFFRKIEASDFLTGRKGDWCGCCFDWVLKPQNIVKIIEGNYDNKLPQSVNTGQGYYIDYKVE